MRSYGVMIFISIVIALSLALLPMPAWTVWMRPAWVLMMLMFWTIFLPARVGVGLAFVVGLIVDLASGTLLGETALAYVCVIYLVSRISIRLRMFPLLQQAMSIFLFVLLYQFIIYCLQGFIGQLPVSKLYWLTSVTSMLFWPWLFLFMQDISRRKTIRN